MSILSFSTPTLGPRPGDVRLTDELLGELALLAPLERRPALYRFGDSVALRRYRSGETVVARGERDARAYYILTAKDVLAALNALCRAARPRRPDPQLVKERDAFRARSAPTVEPDALLHVVDVHPRLAGSANSQAAFSNANSLYEGEILGEVACREGTPQPVTAIAVRDCYLLEMKADFLAAVQEDPVYKSRADTIYRWHILRLQLARLPLFRDLTEEEFARVRDAVELRAVEPGTVIADEHESCEGLFVVRAGVVKLVKNATSLLGVDDVIDWGRLQDIFRDCESRRSPATAVWRRLASADRSLPIAGRPAVLEPQRQARLVKALNQLILSPDLLREPELRPLAEGVLSSGSSEVTRRNNRRALEAALAGTLRAARPSRGTERVLTYAARGEVLGLADLLLDRPWSATAVAFGHPNALGRVELAWLPAAPFRRLLSEVPRLREPLEQETARQKRQMQERLSIPVWDDRAAQLSPEAASMGLIQGQHLMLIDLDRCTRCDDCVRACADSREDGQSRLFLEGLRFGRHLVPATCRACVDPVCVIGCPVGSIHRGPGQEIVIENWCIGCGLCGESCPYGAIQLHDVGIIPETSRAWRFYSAEDLNDDHWHLPDFRATRWPEASSPFVLDRTTRENLTACGLRPDPQSLAFRYDFAPGAMANCDASELRLEVTSPGIVRVRVDGNEVLPAVPPRGLRHVYHIAAASEQAGCRPKVLAVEVRLPSKGLHEGSALFQARLDAIQGDAALEPHISLAGRPVTSRAAVCDLCADQASGPVCIRACPHDAARRVDARIGLPA